HYGVIGVGVGALTLSVVDRPGVGAIRHDTATEVEGQGEHVETRAKVGRGGRGRCLSHAATSPTIRGSIWRLSLSPLHPPCAATRLRTLGSAVPPWYSRT